MIHRGCFIRNLTMGLVISTLMVPARSLGQHEQGSAKTSPEETSADVKTLADLVRQLQIQLQSLNNRVLILEANEKAAKAESANLRAQLTASKSLGSTTEERVISSGQVYAANAGASSSTGQVAASESESHGSDERFSQLEENIELANAKIREQSQTKVESSSKYRVRLSGLALFNLFANRGVVDNQDVPQTAKAPGALDSSGTFGGSLRQSQIGLEAFGPDIAGAHTSAQLRFDFAGGFPQSPNGSLNGLLRLRTGTVRFDWDDTSVIAGQDYLFFSPLSPTSYASLAIPAMSYSGNIWGWAPQVRVEHRFHVSDTSSVTIQTGLLETLSGDMPGPSYERMPTWGERSGGPGFATRLAWSRSAFGQYLVAGVGGYYGRQDWGFSRAVDSWAATADLTVPLGRFVEFTGQFYRGRAVGGLGGGIGQSVLWIGQFSDPTTDVYGLDSMGGWAQLKLKPTVKFEINGAFGEDSPFASRLREFSANPIYLDSLMSRNLTSLVNFVYKPRSDLIFSLEYRHLKTFILDRNFNSANNVNLVVGYIF